MIAIGLGLVAALATAASLVLARAWARERAEARAAAARLALATGVSRAFAEITSDLQRLLDVMAESVGRALEAGCVVRLTDARRQATLRTSLYAHDPSLVAEYRASDERVHGAVPTEGIIPRTLAARAIVREDDGPGGDISRFVAPIFQPVVRRMGASAILGAPLIVRDQVIGVLLLLRRRGFDDADALLARDLADRAALALDNATRVDELEHAAVQRQNRDLVAARERAQTANRHKTEFVENMSHELRTPLNAILGFANLLAAGKGGALAPTQREYVDDILAGARSLLKLVDDVLALASLEASRVSLSYAQLDPRTVFAETEAIVRDAVRAKGLALTTTVDPDVEALTCDPRLFRQVVFNYVENAIKFTPANGTITVRARREGPRELRVEVADTGIGIAAADLSRLFVDFQQLDQGMGKTYQGAGLGLALVRRIVEAHGGRVGVDSAPGTGSTFWAVLPIDGRAAT